MAPLYDSKILIVRELKICTIPIKDILNFWFSDDFITSDFSFIPVPEIAYVLELSNIHRDKIVITRISADCPQLSNEVIYTLANKFGDLGERVELFIGKQQEVIFKKTTGAVFLVDTSLLDKAPKPALDFYIQLINEPNITETTFFVYSKNKCFYVSGFLHKILYNYFVEWFEKLYPGLIVANDCEDSKKMTQLGMKIMYMFYMSQSGAPKVPAYFPDFPKESLLAISSSFDKSALGKLPKSLLKDLETTFPIATLITTAPNKTVTEVIEKVKGFPVESSLLTDLELDEDVNFFTDTTWLSFYNNWEKFLIGCRILLAPDEVVLDSTNTLIFSDDTIDFINFFGTDAPEIPKRLTVEVYVKDSVTPDFISRVKNFIAKMGLSLYSIKSEKFQTFWFDDGINVFDME